MIALGFLDIESAWVIGRGVQSRMRGGEGDEVIKSDLEEPG